MQTTVFIFTLLGMFLVSAAFVYAIKNSQQHDDDYKQISTKAYRIRYWWMVALCIVGLIVTTVTLTPFPLTSSDSDNPRIVKAVSGQWYWKLDNTTAVVGESIQYQVSTVDVNHGFAIFGPDDKIVAQTQAMPGYTNKLNVTFTEPGKHLVRCLEYCGIAHHAMIIEIQVSEAN